MTSTFHHFTRKQLYDLVWSEPIKVLAERYGISDVGLAKTCRRASIPLPQRGFWAKQKAGKSTRQVPLPYRNPGMPDELIVGKGRRDFYWRSNITEAEILGPLPSPPSFDEPISNVKDRVKQLVGKVSVPKTLGSMHPQIARLLDEDGRRREKQKNSPYPSIWDAPLFDTPFERRRLRILNALFLAIGRAGGRPSIRGREARETGATIGEQYVGFTLDRTGKTRRNTSVGTQKIQPEILRFEFKTFGDDEERITSWQDDEVGTLENKIEEIAVALIVNGETQYRESRKRQHQWRIERRAQLEDEIRIRKEEAERKALERRIKIEKDRVDRLLGEANSLRQAREIRLYVATVISTNARSDNPILQIEIDAWAEWALAQANRIDPIVSGSFRKLHSDQQ